jgi:hypothetical protein
MNDLKDYNIDDLFFSVNDIYTQWDEGEIHYDDAEKLLVNCCKAFIKFAKKETSNED